MKGKVFIEHEDHHVLKLYLKKPKQLIKELLTIFFDKETLSKSTLKGQSGKDQLDPDKIKAIYGN